MFATNAQFQIRYKFSIEFILLLYPSKKIEIYLLYLSEKSIMLNPNETFYLKFEEPIIGCLLALKTYILSINPAINIKMS
jgi:hypothetical protein